MNNYTGADVLGFGAHLLKSAQLESFEQRPLTDLWFFSFVWRQLYRSSSKMILSPLWLPMVSVSLVATPYHIFMQFLWVNVAFWLVMWQKYLCTLAADECHDSNYNWNFTKKKETFWYQTHVWHLSWYIITHKLIVLFKAQEV